MITWRSELHLVAIESKTAFSFCMNLGAFDAEEAKLDLIFGRLWTHEPRALRLRFCTDTAKERLPDIT